jgi:hypothetical protein
MRKAYRRRPEDFKRRVVARVTTDRSDLLTEEQRWLHMMREGELRVRYYNITRSVKNFKSWWVNEDGTYLSVIEKNRKSHTGKFHSEESKQRMRVAQSERKTISEEVRQRMRDSHLGKKQSKETVEKRVNAIKGRHHTQESIQKMREAKLGKPLLEGTKQKMRHPKKQYTKRKTVN